MRTTSLLLPLALSLGACATTPVTSDTIATGRFVDRTGTDQGSLTLVGEGSSLTLRANVTGLAPGEHGFHLHTVGSCQTPDFTSAGGHLNPAGNKHGPFNDNGGHLGDLLNITASADGTAKADYPLSGDREVLLNQLFDSDGTAVVVHADADDYQTDPAGAAGSRVLCAAMRRT